jgi:TetR/AcrR family transcriptional regulator
MFEALIDFAEESVFGLITTILEQEKNALIRCEKIVHFSIGFAERNPGITRILLGDALVGENERLRKRVAQFFERLETQFKQILRKANLDDTARATASIDATANLLVAIIEGRMSQYVRCAFEKKPTQHWEEQWKVLKTSLFR